ncbi:hypothetical protein SLAV_25945 [Streptomyces lavendulae subsp. lavendulae]|uniref:Uncharacterized protein n=1 Tax=Streptomyces lavendulae subsp. lavendulae TaxID=58340 RepID=A0A2K8PJR3_STRLA|nr:hypothetical protein [Streptomyces lavendulae]ATZ26981.1 hypothetical protein SLAV_25945 [Streptomyces lavendulae subsp. lavendulae]QUQ56808.1 hypothetical protein SLLC_24080 [Streptomyces lavendulae subsp. lavendulae]GLV86605.1 hypothetical protein Slala03_62940 [Streptomyces lavendulae subsp. lavendulae]
MPRLAVFAVVVCLLAVAAAVVAFMEGSFLGIVWVLLAGLTSNMAWYYVRKDRADKQRRAQQAA